MTNNKDCRMALLPCPFCGGEAEIDDSSVHHVAFCTKCGAMPDDDNGAAFDRSRTQAIKFWNTRYQAGAAWQQSRQGACLSEPEENESQSVLSLKEETITDGGE